MPNRRSGLSVLIVDNDPVLLTWAQANLPATGTDIVFASSIGAAKRLLLKFAANAVVIDVDLSLADGGSFTRRLREQGTNIIVSGKDDLYQKAQFHDVIADDYLSKPFSVAEFEIRIARFCGDQQRLPLGLGRDRAQFDRWHFDARSLQLTSADRIERLTTAEAHILSRFLHSPNRIFSREQLQLRELWQEPSAFERSIDTLVSRIRKKIEADPRAPALIKTIYGAGYLFDCEVLWNVQPTQESDGTNDSEPSQ
ncbi:MAG: response regulator transcription factor [Hyphomicrobiaceae bacterium]|nr:response regulator transcription factor [Hyphomicrobiaceae bacterium]